MSFPTRAARSNRRETLRSIVASSMSPARTASTSACPHGPVRSGHHEILFLRRAVQRADGRPVADHHAVEPPLRAQRRLQQVVLRRRGAVDAVVPAHHRPRPGVDDRVLERAQVQLAQRALVDDDVDREAVGLEVVGDEVLGARRHAAGLQAADVGGGELAGQQRVLAHALEVAPAVRRAVQVDRRAEDDVDALAAGLGAQGLAVASGDVATPRRGQSGRRREVQRRFALVPALAAHAARAVRAQHVAAARCARWRRCSRSRGR